MDNQLINHEWLKRFKTIEELDKDFSENFEVRSLSLSRKYSIYRGFLIPGENKKELYEIIKKNWKIAIKRHTINILRDGNSVG